MEIIADLDTLKEVFILTEITHTSSVVSVETIF